MKFFQYTYYFFRSLNLRGIRNTFKLLAYENKYEKQLGINTLRIENLNNLTLASENSKQNHHYQGASYYVLFSIFKKLPEEIKNSPFIDFGCGKGRAIFVAEQFGFNNLIGIDIAKELITKAKDNQKNYSYNNSSSKIDFIFEDAVQYKIPDNAAVFYFFNPFGEVVLKKVVQNIKNSLKQSSRKIYCIYLNPLYRKVFEQNGFEIFSTEKNNKYLEGIIYVINTTEVNAEF